MFTMNAVVGPSVYPTRFNNGSPLEKESRITYKRVMQLNLNRIKNRAITVATATSLLMVTYSTPATAEWTDCLENGYEYIKDIANEGKHEFHLPVYAWHARFAYSNEKINRYNEILYGFGYGRGKTDCEGNWTGIFGMWFLDSHKNVEPLLGIARTFNILKYNAWEGNIGFAALLTARKDIKNYTPFPGILPVLSIAYQPVTIYASYIPVGNVVCIFSKYTF